MQCWVGTFPVVSIMLEISPGECTRAGTQPVVGILVLKYVKYAVEGIHQDRYPEVGIHFLLWVYIPDVDSRVTCST